MASGTHARLSRLLLQQSDRHPIRTLSGEDLADFDPAAVQDFQVAGLLARGRDLREGDGLVFHSAHDGGCLATSLREAAVEQINALATACYDIDFLEIARLLRQRAKLEGRQSKR